MVLVVFTFQFEVEKEHYNKYKSIAGLCFGADDMTNEQIELFNEFFIDIDIYKHSHREMCLDEE